MEEFILLSDKDTDEVLRFLDDKSMDNSIVVGNILNHGIDDASGKKKRSTYYGYFIENTLKGVFAFLSNGCFIPFYVDDRVLNKIVLLKTIKQHKPKYIMGNERKVKSLFKILEKTSKCISYDKCSQMILYKNKFELFTGSGQIIEAKNYDFSKTIDFLIEVEKSFGRNPHTVNDLKSKVFNRIETEDYLYLLENDKIISQALIQLDTPTMSEIGGVFTLPSFRGNNYAKIIVSELCRRVIGKNKTPFLIVSDSNEGAINLYRSIGFEKYNDYLLIEVQIM